MQPAAAQRLRGGVGVFPVAGHHAVRARDDLAHFPGGQLVLLVVEDLDFHAAARETAGGKALDRILAVKLLGQPGNGHGGFPLPVELVEARPEQVDRAQRIGDIHRRAAIDEGLQVARRARARAGEQPDDHRRRGEERHVLPVIEQVENLLRLEVAAFRDHVHRAGGEVRQAVEAGAVGQRRRVQHRVARPELVDVGEIRQGLGPQVAVREHRAFRHSRGAAGVEQPGGGVRANLGRNRFFI